MARRNSDDVCQTLEVIGAKLELLTQFNEERLGAVHDEIKDIKLLVNDISKDHEHRLKTLEATQSYQRGIIALVVFIAGAVALPLIKAWYNI